MMLFKLSLKNIQKSFKDYAIYFFTLILGVAIFYVFNAIESQTVLLQVTSITMDIINLMTNMLSGVSVFVSFILGFLIIYASRFLIKRRNKEFGIYLTLGMSKRKISSILFVETLFIGIISLAIGLIIGVALSQVMSLLVASMFEADMTQFAFIFSKSAFLKTLIYFGIMYLVVMIFNVISISRCKLIDLLYANKKSEKVKLKNPWLCIFIFIIAVLMLSYAYYKVTIDVSSLQTVDEIFIPIILGSISTFLIFWALSGLILKIVQSFKRFYYRGLNSFIIKQISSKINTTVASMSIICLMLFITICVLSSSLSIKNSMSANLEELAPVDISITKTRNITPEKAQEYGYSQEIITDSFLSITETLANLDFDVNEHFKDMITVHYYVDESLTIEKTLGSYYEETKKTLPFLTYDMPEEIIPLSEYNKVAELYGNETFTLAEDEYLIIADYESMVAIRNEALKRNTPITILGKTYYPKYTECQDGFVEISSNHITAGIIIVPDLAVQDSILERESLIANYNRKNADDKRDIENILLNLDNHPYAVNTNLDASSKLRIYESSVGLGAMVTFIGLYLGIVFLISSAAILALKELSESTDNTERYKMLRKIGVEEKLLNRALFIQILIFFVFPLILAIVHSVFGIEFCKFILETFGDEEMTKSITMTAIFLVVIYGGYFLITYYSSKNIIRNR